MPASQHPLSVRLRRVCVATLVVALCCVWAAPVVAGGPDAPVDTPTPPVETPTAPGPTDPVENATEPVTTPVPDRNGTSEVQNGSAAVQTEADESADRLEYVGSEVERSWSSVDRYFGPAPDRRGSTATPRADSTTPTPGVSTATASDQQSSTSPTPTATTSAAAGGCSDCGGGLPAGVVLLGLVGGAGAVSLGAVPQSSIGQATRALGRWVDHRGRRLPPLFVGRFGRGSNPDPLSHRQRRAVCEIVDDRPGIHLGAVVDQIDLSRSSVRHHVRVLEEADELETTKLLGRRRLFPPDADTELFAALADEGSRRVVQAVATVEPASVGEVVDEVDRAYSTVSYHLDRLESAGVVVRERDGRRVSVRLATDVADRLGTGDVVAAD